MADVLQHFDAVRKSGDGHVARCPAHQDTHQSLSIGTGDDGRTLLHCHVGCSTEAVVEAAGLTMTDLFPPRTRANGQTRPASTRPAALSGCTLATYAAQKHLDVATLQTYGLTDMKYMSVSAIRIPYRTPDGHESAVRFRVALAKSPDGDQRFRWRRGSKVTLYGLDRLDAARAAGYVTIVEGESDCHTLWHHNVPAVGLPGAGTWREAWAEHLDSLGTIYVVIEPDAGGEAVIRRIGPSSIRDRVRLVRLPEDVSALHVADPDGFVAAWAAACEAAESYADFAARQSRETADAAWTDAADLATAPNILDRLDESLTALGVVGERRAARLLYLAVTSRYFARPISVAVKGPSSGGKSYTTEAVLQHHPPAAYYALSGMSERALAYSTEPLHHRMLVIFEAAGMAGDFATYLIRSLLSEGRIRYEVVEKTKDGLTPRLIEREGPTGLITTTTAVHLHAENETRLLSIPVTDTREQTRDIFRATAAGATTIDRDAHLRPWHALQTWLASAEHRVEVPFAAALAEAIPPVAIRLRRDFSMLLSLVRAHALLHQATRSRTPDGQVAATVADYAAVRELVADLFDVAVAATVADTTRETVAAVAALVRESSEGVSIGRVGAALRLDKSTASRRVAVAVADGYLTNLAAGKRGVPARLVIGDPLPDRLVLLPEPAELAAHDHEGIDHAADRRY